MPTTVAKIVDPDNGAGTHYLSLNAFEAGEQRNLVTADEIAQANCRCSAGSADTTSVTFAGWTTDATRYVKVVGDNTTGVWSTAKYRLDITNIVNNAVILCQVSNLIISAVQIVFSSAGSSYSSGIGQWSGVSSLTIDKCIIRHTGTKGAEIHGTSLQVSGSTYKVSNCIVYDFDTQAAASGGIRSHLATAYFYNNTVYNCGRGIFRNSSGTVIAKNNIAQNCTDGFSGTFNEASNHNLSDIASDAPGANSITATVTFVNAAGGNFALADSDTSGAKEGGTDLSADPNLPVTTDITGAARPLTGVSMGAFQYFGVAFKFWLNQYRKMRTI